jgi:hypothetical protein
MDVIWTLFLIICPGMFVRLSFRNHCWQGSQELYITCHLTSNKVAIKLECAEDKFQTRGWVPGREK